jgi:hypothetical protein
VGRDERGEESGVVDDVEEEREADQEKREK